MEKLNLPTPKNFSFKSTIFSHGWSDLKPFVLNEKPLTISYVCQTSTDSINLLNISADNNQTLKIIADGKLTNAEKNHILKVINRMFRLDEDFDEFYKIASESNDFLWVINYGAGRLLRTGSLWEDMVKMLCTTNCTWRLTQIMTENLVTKLGAKKVSGETGHTIQAFPEPQDLVNQTEEFLRTEIKMGYRAPYLLEFANQVASGEIDLDQFEKDSLSSVELYKQLKQIKGFGDYAVSNLLKLLGRYDNMGADSWSSQKFSQKHNKGKKADAHKIFSHYKKYGKWAGLFFWMDVSEDWYTREIPW